MEIRLSPEVEALLRQDVQRGVYPTIDVYVERAVRILHDQEAWLASNRSEIAAKIEEGCKAAQRGELVDPEVVRTRLNLLKKARSQDPPAE